MAVLLFCSAHFFSRLLTKENTAKFLIRQKDTGNLGAEHKNKKQQCYIIVRSKDALTPQSHDFVHGKELAFFSLADFIDCEVWQLSGHVGKAKQIIKAMNLLHLLPLFSSTWIIFEFSSLHLQ